MKRLLFAVFVCALSTSASAQDLCRVQERLAELGLYDGERDCQSGPMMREAIRRFQRQNGLVQDGVLGEDTVCRLLGNCRSRPSERVEEDEERGGDGYSERRSSMNGQCSDESVEASVMRATESRGKNGAIKAWRSEVLRRDGLGLSWNSWSAAADSSLQCKELASWNWNCVAKARPCKDQ